MAEIIKTIIFNSDREYSGELRADLLSVPGVHIVCETDDPAFFQNFIQESSVEIVLVHLSPEGASFLPLIKEMAYAHPNLSVFGVSSLDDSRLILDAMRAGMREFMVRPIDRKQLADSISQVARFRPSNLRHSRLICVTGSTGGMGSTTIATNLACELSSLNRQGVVLVDLDLSCGQVSTFLDMSPQFSLADLAGQETSDDAMIRKALVKYGQNLHVLFGSTHSLSSPPVIPEACNRVLNLLTDMFEWVVCDGPTRAQGAANGIWEMADTIVIVMQLVVTSVRSTEQLLRKFQKQGFNLDRVHVAVNRFGGENGLVTLQDAERALGRKVRWVLPSDWKAVSTAVNMGQPLSVAARKSKMTEAIRRVAQEIHAGDGTPRSVPENGKAGLFSKVWGR